MGASLGKDMGVSPEKILEELAAIGFARAGDVLGIEEGEVVLKTEVPEGVSAAISSIESTSAGIKVKFYDKMRALELLGKSMGLFGGKAVGEQGNLLEALLRKTQEEMDTDDLPEVRQAPGDYLQTKFPGV